MTCTLQVLNFVPIKLREVDQAPNANSCLSVG
jgi:hypothetical protein